MTGEDRRTAVAEIVLHGRVRLDEAHVRLGVNRRWLERCLRLGVVEAREGPGGEPAVDELALARLRRAVRLHRDLDVSWKSMPLVLDLIDRIEALERELEAGRRPRRR